MMVTRRGGRVAVLEGDHLGARQTETVAQVAHLVPVLGQDGQTQLETVHVPAHSPSGHSVNTMQCNTKAFPTRIWTLEIYWGISPVKMKRKTQPSEPLRKLFLPLPPFYGNTESKRRISGKFLAPS